MGWYSAFTTTGGVSRAYTTTTGQQTFVISGGSFNAFTVTVGNQVYSVTGGNSIAFPVTVANAVYPVVGGSVAAFLVTPEPDPSKLLVLRNNKFEFNSGYTVTTVFDETGDYNPTTNPNGYQPPLDPPDPLRPYRSDLNLWTVYRVLTSTGANTILFPTAQNEEGDVDYAYPLDTPDSGIYDVIIIGAPSTELYADYLRQNIVQYAASQTNWFVSSTWVTIDPDLDKCIIGKRWDFLQSVMCGRCDTEYLEMYALYVALFNANSIQSPSALIIYDKLKEMCSANPGCNTCC